MVRSSHDLVTVKKDHKFSFMAFDTANVPMNSATTSTTTDLTTNTFKIIGLGRHSELKWHCHLSFGIAVIACCQPMRCLD